MLCVTAFALICLTDHTAYEKLGTLRALSVYQKEYDMDTRRGGVWVNNILSKEDIELAWPHILPILKASPSAKYLSNCSIGNFKTTRQSVR